MDGGVLQEKVFLKIFQNSHENTCAGISFLIKVVFLQISKNTFLTEHVRLGDCFYHCAILIPEKKQTGGGEGGGWGGEDMEFQGVPIKEEFPGVH